MMSPPASSGEIPLTPDGILSLLEDTAGRWAELRSELTLEVDRARADTALRVLQGLAYRLLGPAASARVARIADRTGIR